MNLSQRIGLALTCTAVVCLALTVGSLQHRLNRLQTRVLSLERNALQFTTNAPFGMTTIQGFQNATGRATNFWMIEEK